MGRETENSRSSELLLPSLELTYWRSVTRSRYREHPEFSKKKRHFEPEDHNAFASRWASELSAEENKAEIRQIYENAVTIFGNKRSQMERGGQSLDCEQFRFTIGAIQDPEDPRQIQLTRSLWIKVPLGSLPEHFDDLFPFRMNEIVVPFTGSSSPREILELMEHWEERLKGKLQESADQNSFILNLRSGFAMTVNVNTHEISFVKEPVEGVLALAGAVAQDLKNLGIKKSLGS
jgi:hypothetical protein